MNNKITIECTDYTATGDLAKIIERGLEMRFNRTFVVVPVHCAFEVLVGEVNDSHKVNRAPIVPTSTLAGSIRNYVECFMDGYEAYELLNR